MKVNEEGQGNMPVDHNPIDGVGNDSNVERLKEQVELFHHSVAKLLFVCKHTRSLSESTDGALALIPRVLLL